MYRHRPVVSSMPPAARASGSVFFCIPDYLPGCSVRKDLYRWQTASPSERSWADFRRVRNGSVTFREKTGIELLSSRRAHGGGSEAMGETHPFLRQRIQRRRFDILVAIATDIGPAHVIGHQQHDVRSGCCCSLQDRRSYHAGAEHA